MHLAGIVARSDMVKPSLAHFDEEHRKERFRRIVALRKRRTRKTPRAVRTEG